MTSLSPCLQPAGCLARIHHSQPARPHLRREATRLDVATHGQAKRAAVHGGGTHGCPGFKDGQADLRPLGESTTISSQARARVVCRPTGGQLAPVGKCTQGAPQPKQSKPGHAALPAA